MLLLRSTALLLLSATTAATTTHAAVTVCPKAGSLEAGLPYHADSTCDRATYNAYKCSLNRHLKYAAFKAQGGIVNVPSEKTVKCPAAGARVELQEEQSQTGMDTVWFVENQASTPIVVAYVNQQGLEVSVKNPKISPAVADPQAHVAPGAWMAVYATEGHQFVARQVLKSGAAGNVLLQHRAGLIPVGAHADGLQCPLDDVEPVVNATRAPQFARTPPAALRPCHTMDVGFRNVAPCPLHGYYVSGEGEGCRESFKFHLGVQQTELEDYMWQWQSATKYEGTFVGHTFHFRLASDPTVLVDTVTLAPVVVTDCPTDKVAVPVGSHSDAVADSVQRGDRINDNSNNATMFDYVPQLNATPGAFLAMDGSLHSI